MHITIIKLENRRLKQRRGCGFDSILQPKDEIRWTIGDLGAYYVCYALGKSELQKTEFTCSNLLGQNKPLRGELSAMYRASSWRLNSRYWDFKDYFYGISIAVRRDIKSGNKDISDNLSFSQIHLRIKDQEISRTIFWVQFCCSYKKLFTLVYNEAMQKITRDRYRKKYRWMNLKRFIPFSILMHLKHW